MRVVLTGASGQLGVYLLECLQRGGFDVLAWSGSETGVRAGVTLRPVDLTDQVITERALEAADPALVIHTAAIASADAVRRDPVRGTAVNVAATGHLADWCARERRRFILTSTDMVFDGTKSWWNEGDTPNPLSEYGRTKLRAERIAQQVPGSLTVRLSLLYGPSRCGKPGFFDKTLDALRRGEPQTFFRDEFRTPLALATAAEAIVGLARSSMTGVLHLGGRERLSRYEFMLNVAEANGIDSRLVLANFQSDVPSLEPRPADVSLDTTRLSRCLPDHEWPGVDEALRRMCGLPDVRALRNSETSEQSGT